MRFSVTKDVAWEPDGESGDSELCFTVKKRYRFVFDLSRRSTKRIKASRKKRASFESPLLEKNYHHRTWNHHACYGCGEIRSADYHEQHPVKRGKEPKPSLCNGCRYDRKARIADRARGGRHSRRSSKLEARIDDWQWCSNCGTLRSDRYHDMYFSGAKLPPWAEVCTKCAIAEKEKQRMEQLRERFKELDIEKNRGSRKEREIVYEVFPRRRSSPYTLKPDPDPCRLEPTSGLPPASGISSTAEQSSDSDSCEQRSVTSNHSGSDADNSHVSSRPETKSSIHNITIEEDAKTSDNRHQVVKGDHRVPALEQTEDRHQPHHQDECGSSPEYAKKQMPSQPREESTQIPVFTSLEDDNGRHTYRPDCQYPEAKPTPAFSFPPYEFQLRPQTQQYQEQPQQPRPPMGISDMYWASAEGQAEAEQSFAADGYFFPGDVLNGAFFAPGNNGSGIPASSCSHSRSSSATDAAASFSSGFGEPRPSSLSSWEKKTSGACNDFFGPPTQPSTGHTSPTSEYAPRHDVSQQRPKKQQQQHQPQIWEVDSDEADKIEEDRVKLFTHRKV